MGDIPRPVRYYRSYYSRLRRIGDLYPCWSQMAQWGSAGEPKKKPPVKASDVRASAEKAFERRSGKMSKEELDFFDADGDGSVTKEEFVEVYSGWAATELAVRKEKATRLPKLKPDMNLEMPVSKSEL